MEQSAIINRLSPGDTALDNVRARYNELLFVLSERELLAEEWSELDRLYRCLVRALRRARRTVLVPCPHCDGEGQHEYFRSPSCSYDHIEPCEHCIRGTIEVDSDDAGAA